MIYTLTFTELEPGTFRIPVADIIRGVTWVKTPCGTWQLAVQVEASEKRSNSAERRLVPVTLGQKLPGTERRWLGVATNPSTGKSAHVYEVVA